MLGIPFQILTKFVSIRKGSLTSRYSKLYLAFTASAFLHHFPSFIHGIGRDADSQDQLIYFLIQPLAITFEDFIIYLGRKAGVKESCKSLKTRFEQVKGRRLNSRQGKRELLEKFGPLLGLAIV